MLLLVVLAALLLLLLLQIISSYRTCNVSVHCKNEKVRELIKASIFTLYTPAIWAGGFLQTLLRSLVERHPDVPAEITYIERKDGGIISLEKYPGEANNNIQPVLLIIPSTLNPRCKHYSGIQKEAARAGYIPLLLNRRGYATCSFKDDVVVPYCDTTDLESCLDYIAHKYPFSDIVAVAYSVDAATLIRYLGEKGEFGKIQAAVCISSPVNLSTMPWCVKDAFKSTLDTLLQRVFNIMDEEQAVLSYMCMKPVKNRNYMISVPTLFINASDDPLVKPPPASPASDSCVLINTDRGGHCGFYAGFNLTSWTDKIALEFVELALNKRATFLPKNSYEVRGKRSKTFH